MWQSIFSLLIVFLVIGRCCLSNAHEVSTHENVTHRAIEYLIQRDPTLAGIQNITDKIVFGSEDEDSGNRFFFHFLPTLPNLASCDSLEWGFLDELCIAQAFGVEFIQRNTHKWQDAVSQADSGKGFDHLGYVLHLLEDLTSPAHTRKDAHPPGDSDPFEKHNEDRCGAAGECIPQKDLISIPLNANPQRFFIDLRDFTATNFFSEDTIKADIFTQNPPCDFLGGDPQPCGPTATRLEDNYYIEEKNGKKRKIARHGFFGPFIDRRVAQEQFDELAPVAVRYVASLIKFYIERANPPLPPAIIGLNANPSSVPINGQSVISVEAADPNGDPLTYAWAATCGTLSSFAGPENKTVTAPDTPGTCTVNVTVTDPSGASDIASVDIEVTPAVSREIIFSNLGPGDSFETGGAAYGFGGDPLSGFTTGGIDQAAVFIPQGNFFLDSIELPLKLRRILLSGEEFLGPNELDLSVMADANGAPGEILESIYLIDAMSVGEPALTVANSVLRPLLRRGVRYWLVVSANTPTGAEWPINSISDIGLQACRARNAPDSTFCPPNTPSGWRVHTALHGAFRITGAPSGPE